MEKGRIAVRRPFIISETGIRRQVQTMASLPALRNNDAAALHMQRRH
jgi:hypothetical protein